MKWNVGTKIAGGFGLALAVFVLVGAASYYATAHLIEVSDSRRRTYIVLGQLDEPLPLLKEVELGNRSYYLTDEQRFLDASRSAADKIGPVLAELRKLTGDNPRQQQRLDALAPLIKSRLDFASETVRIYRAEGQKAAVQRIKAGQGKALNDQIAGIVGQMQEEERALLKQRVEEADANGGYARWTIVLGTLAGLGLALLAGYVLTRDIAEPLKEISERAQRIAAGDLGGPIITNGREDEIGDLIRSFAVMAQSLQGVAEVAGRIAAGDLRVKVAPQSERDVLGNAFASMVENLQQLTTDLAQGVAVLGASANDIVAATAQLASSASESAAAVSQTTVTVEEVRQTAQVASQKAKLVADSAQKAAQISQSGRKSTDDAGAGMNRIRQQMEAIAASMVRLSEQSQAIGQIVAAVEDLSVQSNLLAVNAAIEAAKAGEQGKGFGVVAQEVKSLAEQSRQATAQVRTLLGDIQKATGAAVMATEEGSKAVEAGSRHTEVAASSIQALSGSITEASQAATQIAASSVQQLVGVDQVAGAMESIKQASAQNVAGARQLEGAARNLNELGLRLRQMVARYSV